ncbi:hypothetical protein EGW08_017111 [Elysia chlorotica]|uniref:Uncharacterized protein n=1 Tax=Elysia chlorotica TaxID=188477 RepID=A0A433T0U3_ELYCH|nr:hypothetical protein EGW08_017111 [Elysia chlorotica]
MYVCLYIIKYSSYFAGPSICTSDISYFFFSFLYYKSRFDLRLGKVKFIQSLGNIVLGITFKLKMLETISKQKSGLRIHVHVLLSNQDCKWKDNCLRLVLQA